MMFYPDSSSVFGWKPSRQLEKLLLVMPIAPQLFRGRALGLSFVDNHLAKVCQVIQRLDVIRTVASHGSTVICAPADAM